MPGLDAGTLLAPLREYGSVGLAVSGGPDSLALMLLAARMPDRRRVVVYSVDHGLRPESADEAAFVIRTATALGLPARALRWTGRKPKTGLQQAARRARYRLIGDSMEADRVPVLATAHHLHDQAETVLMRLAHGSGLEGLRGMDLFADVEGVTLVRPLLAVDPADLRAEVDAAGLVPANDPSNADTDYARVRWRQMMPQLAELGLDAARIAKFATRARDADHALAAWVTQLGSGLLTRDWLREMPRAVAIRFIQNRLIEVGRDGKPHALSAIETLTDRLRREPVRRTTLQGCIISSDGERIVIEREPLSGARGARILSREDRR